MAPHDSAAKNKGEYDSCVACYFRDELRGCIGGRDNDDDDVEEETGVHGEGEGLTGQSQPERCHVVVLRPNKDREDAERKGRKQQGSEAGDNKGLSRFCV